MKTNRPPADLSDMRRISEVYPTHGWSSSNTGFPPSPRAITWSTAPAASYRKGHAIGIV